MIAKYPPMGWNSWDCFGPSVFEERVRLNAEYIAKYLKPYGWEYVVIDAQWFQPTSKSYGYVSFPEMAMDEYGRFLPAVEKFPSAAGGLGFKPLADYIHSLGLKFGVHLMRGIPRQAAQRHKPILDSPYNCDELANPNDVCPWNPDMYGIYLRHPGAQDYYNSVFRLQASWGVDYIKFDDVARSPIVEKEVELMTKALHTCGREMVLSLSPGPADVNKAEFFKTHANLWRITDDFWDEWPLLRDMFDRAAKWCIHSGPGHWPDADMLPVGMLRAAPPGYGWGCRPTKFTHAEQRTMMTLWCMMRSPLMVGAELPRSDDFTRELLTNAEVLKIQRESYFGHPLYNRNDECVWAALRQDGKGGYVALFNLADEERELSVDPDELEIPWTEATELWSGEECTSLSRKLEPHGAAVWYIR